MSPATSSQPPLVVHVIYRLAVGGLENGLVNLINTMSPERYRHAIVCIDSYTDFRWRIQRPDVEVYALQKRAGHDLSVFWRFWRLMRRLRPAIVHTRNLAALEFQVPALFAGVRHRIQSEHGREGIDTDGRYGRYNRLRRMFRPLVHRYIALSRDLENWLCQEIRVPAPKLEQIYNGVDCEKFRPLREGSKSVLPAHFAGPDSIVIGTVGRMEPVKDQLTLVRAFLELLRRLPQERERLRLVLVGDGSLREQARTLLKEHGALEQAWLPETRNDVADLLRDMDIFVLPSLGEGISNTILEAMASGLPVVATRVGGNPELVIDGETGRLVAVADPHAMADAIQEYITDAALRIRHGEMGRARAEHTFAMDNMARNYLRVYDSLLLAAE
jgi:sugar transferase (PEP-CTERM/EpsH1 system associated)